MARKLFAILASLYVAGCTETPSTFPPCLDPKDNFMNDCPAPDAGDGGVDAADGAADAGDGSVDAADSAADAGIDG
jgi:hypothetical protein